MASIRFPAVAGMFYPRDPRQLHAALRGYLGGVQAEGPAPKAIIVPHAGYAYSGPIAASAYARLAPARGIVNRVVLVGPAHRVWLRGLAATAADGFRTPLGDVPVDRDTVQRLLAMPQVRLLDEAHKDEHSLEVHLPFLQEVLGKFSLVPLVAGEATDDGVADVLAACWGGPETLVVISSDLSHYLDYDTARRKDAATSRAIETLAPGDIGKDQACGRIPIRGLLTLARRFGLGAATLDLRNSGDTAGPRDRVVGYGSWAFLPEAARPESRGPDRADIVADRQSHALLRVAVEAIRSGLRKGRPPEIHVMSFAPELQAIGACFVTLKREGMLRGCIGSPRAYRPLVADVALNAYHAAFKDPRFPPLKPAELRGLAVSILLLTAPEPISVLSEADLSRQLRVGVDGLILAEGRKRSLFLPAVWESLPDPRDFVSQLKKKAGFGAEYWSPRMSASRFTARSIETTIPGEAAAGSA